ncbi:MAG TPA: metallophosphoesterase family protein [Candidatus Eisenbacteria bacterium]|nr:metallophosphoesterase family protein [Candidatus Eisenbacteria bacterium]
MKCLLVSDLHYTLKQLDWLDRVATDFDLVVIAGDHLDISSAVSLDAQIVVTLKYLARLHTKTRLLVSSGNHDLNARTDDEKVAAWMTRVRALGVVADGDGIDIDGTLFTVCPWWDGPRARDAVGAQLARDAGRRTKGWVWVYHAPPDASPVSWAGHQHYGDADLVRWIGEHAPDIVLTGHIHQSPFRRGGSWVDRIGSTWVFNAGRQIGPVPTHVILDTTARTASWFSLAGDATVSLDGPFERPVPEAQ